eukprot:6202002-Pleurochrysis_carterae.AAC.2
MLTATAGARCEVQTCQPFGSSQAPVWQEFWVSTGGCAYQVVGQVVNLCALASNVGEQSIFI